MGCSTCKKRKSDNGKVKTKPDRIKKNKLTEDEVNAIKKQLESLGFK